MPTASGRDLVIKIGAPATAIATVRSKSVAINNERIDTTNDDSDGWQQGLSEAGLRSVEIQVSGVVSSAALRIIAYSATPQAVIEVLFSDTATLGGTFMITGYTESGEFADAIAFEATFSSNSEATYTAAV